VVTNDIPSSDTFTGLSRKVIEYSECFKLIVEKIKQKKLTDADWVMMEKLVDVEHFRRVGQFLTNTVETSTWAQ